MEHPKDVGDRTTLAIMLVLREAGYHVAVPFGENTRYDIVLDDGARLLRVQCKTGRVRFGAVEFATASSYAHHQTRNRAVGTTGVRSTNSPSIAERRAGST